MHKTDEQRVLKSSVIGRSRSDVTISFPLSNAASPNDFFVFCWIKVLTVQPDHYMAMGCRIGSDISPERNERRPGEPLLV